jgi:hypothetical protein
MSTNFPTLSLGSKVCCGARDGARVYSHGAIYTGGIYELVARKSDGIPTFRRVGSFGGTRAGRGISAKFMNELRESAPHQWLGVRHGQVYTGELCA